MLSNDCFDSLNRCCNIGVWLLPGQVERRRRAEHVAFWHRADNHLFLNQKGVWNLWANLISRIKKDVALFIFIKFDSALLMPLWRWPRILAALAIGSDRHAVLDWPRLRRRLWSLSEPPSVPRNGRQTEPVTGFDSWVGNNSAPRRGSLTLWVDQIFVEQCQLGQRTFQQPRTMITTLAWYNFLFWGRHKMLL